MTPYMQPFLQYLNYRRIPYRQLSPDMVEIVHRGKNLANIPFVVLFDDEGDNSVQLFCRQIALFNDNNFTAGVAECNDVNINYKYVRFYMDDSMNVIANYDMLIRDNNFVVHITDMLAILADIIDEVYPNFVHALWG